MSPLEVLFLSCIRSSCSSQPSTSQAEARCRVRRDIGEDRPRATEEGKQRRRGVPTSRANPSSNCVLGDESHGLAVSLAIF